VILIWSSVTDSPAIRVLDALTERGAPVLLLETERLSDLIFEVVFSPEPSGFLKVAGHHIDVAEVTGLYLRPMDIPEHNLRALLSCDMLFGLAETMSGCVVNRPGPSRPNHSKPYQSRLIAQAGFDVPDTLVTTDIALAREFLRVHGTLVYKSVSGIRSIVARLDRAEASRLDGAALGPIQFQAFVPGLDVRVHVVGSRWFACAAHSSATDYRYAAKQGLSVELQALDLPTTIGERVVAMVRNMGLRVAGVDMRWTPDGRWFCLEVNPSPGFTWYEDATGHQIARAIADELEAGAGHKQARVNRPALAILNELGES
jgi:glutathione synthase/RimK-type ligase-like ATP-grasp enzyme